MPPLWCLPACTLLGGPYIPDEGVVKRRDIHPARVVLCQSLGQLEGLVQGLQGSAGVSKGEVRGPLPGPLPPTLRLLTSPTTLTMAPSFLSRSMVRAGVVLGTTMVDGMPSFLAA